MNLSRNRVPLDPAGADLLVAVATYNEIDNLPTLVTAIRNQLPAARILVVDDNSPDGTGDWCAEFALQNDWLECLHRPGKLGLGSAAWLAMQGAIERQVRGLVTLDADWSHPPEALGRMIEAADVADLVVGSRYCPGGSIVGWPLSRRVVSRVMNAATGMILGSPVSDASTAYRLYRRELLEQLDFSHLQATGYAYLEEILIRSHLAGASMVEVPIVFTDRRAGASKAGVAEALGKLGVLWRLGRERAVRSR